MKALYLLVFLFTAGLINAQTPMVAAHRCKAPFIPENTIRGIEKLLPLGLDYLEIDVRTSADGELVIMHDGSLKRMTNSKKNVKDLTLEQLKKLKITGMFKISSGKDKIPTLQEVCKTVADWNKNNPCLQTGLYVDCKDAEPEKLMSILDEYNLLKTAVFYGRDSYLLELREIYSEVKIMPALRDTSQLHERAEKLKPYAFDVSSNLLSEHFVNAIHSKNIKVFTDLFLLNDRKPVYKKMKKMGVDLIQTDRSKRALKVLNRF